MRYQSVVRIVAQTKRYNHQGDWQVVDTKDLGDLFLEGTWRTWFPLRLSVHGNMKAFVADDLDTFKRLLQELGIGEGKVPYSVARNRELAQVRPRYGTRRSDDPWGWIKAR